MRSLKIIVLAALVSAACGASAQLPHERRADRKAIQKRLSAFENPGLRIGAFPLAAKGIIDGDTVKVEGLGASLRLLCIDAEETFKYDSERRAYEAGWDAYMKNMRGNSPRPVKYATPVGDEGKTFAQRFFAGHDTVELERDDPKEIRDYYNRYLAYVFVTKDGVRKNFNVEIVRAGLSPYFSKYGYSRRFHDEFVQAENEARVARRGIWDPTKQHYPDYEERKAWWDGRAEFIRRFEEEARAHTNYIALTSYDTPLRLEEMVGKEVVILGAVSEIRIGGGKGPTIVSLSRRRGQDFPLVFFDPDVFLSSGVKEHLGEYVRVKGFVARYEDKKRGRYQLQVKIELPGQIVAAADRHAPPR
jgi:endonuclease YncB( thermonuclease family)